MNAEPCIIYVYIACGEWQATGCSHARVKKSSCVQPPSSPSSSSEQEDFASGTSSRSTKLLHGGVRYLEKAVQGLDMSQLKLVFEALHERAIVMGMAPHLTSALPIMMPCYQWWEVPYFWLGMKVRDTSFLHE